MATSVEGGSSVASATAAAASLSLQDSTPQSEAVTAVKPQTNGDLEPDGYPVDLEIPVRYIKGMEGDKEEARRRWIDTLKVLTCTRLCNCVICPMGHVFREMFVTRATVEKHCQSRNISERNMSFRKVLSTRPDTFD